MCAIIDNSIHLGYKIYPINYVAYDTVTGSNRFRSSYSDEELSAVNEYLDNQLSKIPDVTDEDYAYMRNMMLEMYANPLRNKLVAEGAE